MFQTLFQESSSGLKKAALVWIGAGALVGGLTSAGHKLRDIGEEPQVEYKNKTYERPIRFTFQASRVAMHAGMGAAIGGFTAATAPVSIPLYVWWRSDMDEDMKSETNITYRRHNRMK